MTALEVSGNEADFAPLEDVLEDVVCAHLIMHVQEDSDALAGQVFGMPEQLGGSLDGC